jgi:hypothetical protein
VRLALAILAGCGPATPTPLANTAAHGDPIMVAVRGEHGVTIAALDGGVRVLGTIDDVAAFGWYDRHTLIGLGEYGAPMTLHRIVDGALVQTWVANPNSGSDDLLRAEDGVYVRRCPERGEPIYGCTEGATYVRVYPTVGTPTQTAPRSLDEAWGQQSYFWDDANPWPLPPTVAGPADVTLSTGAGHVVCRRGDIAITWPTETEQLEPNTMTKATLRWVQSTPAIFEAAADFEGPQWWPTRRLYFRPCDPRPLDGYVWFSDGTWGSFAVGPDKILGTWTFWHGTAAIGTLPGLPAARANR